MIGFIIFIVMAILAAHAWLNYSNKPSVGRFIVAAILTFLALPSLLGAIFKVATIILIIVGVLALIPAIAGLMLKDPD